MSVLVPLHLTGYIYPALLTALVPVRSFILSKLFSERDLKYLDPTDVPAEEYEEEQHKIRHHRNDSFSSDGSHPLPHFGEFHPDALKKALRKRKNPSQIEEVTSLPPALDEPTLPIDINAVSDQV